MHNTLTSRKRVKYEAYTWEEQENIRKMTMQFLDDGDTQPLEKEIDSLHMIREIFSQIKTEYKKTSQQIESLSRQMKDNPEKFKQTLQQ